MKKIFIVVVLFSIALAKTPFTLTHLKNISVLVEKKSVIDADLKQKFEARMHTSLKRLGINTKGYFNDVLTLLPKTDTVGDTKLVTFRLVLIGPVTREGMHEPVFGITYMMEDSIEVNEDFKEEALESVEFLLSEFSEQYTSDNEE